ncbi:MAG: hypothetical protein GY832_12850 [Chloroflexi bacterium]|nr:hypothetical protein [Chloroflexota bacterium]
MIVSYRMHKQQITFALFLFLLLIVACGRLPADTKVGDILDHSPTVMATVTATKTARQITQTTTLTISPSPDPTATATATVAVTENALPVTQAATLPVTPTPPLQEERVPTVTATSLPPEAVYSEPPTPYCRPSEAWMDISASAITLKVGQVVSVTLSLVSGDTTDTRLGQIEYLLDIEPPSTLIRDNLDQVMHPVSLLTGESDKAEFVLQATAPGQAVLTGSTNFEIHAMDYSWGSWSGCNSWPLEIVITP